MPKMNSGKASEYGGVPGMIQPPPHDPADSAYETMYLMKNTNPAGVVDEAGKNYVADDTDPEVPPTKRLR